MLGPNLGSSDFLGSGDHLDLESLLVRVGPTSKYLAEIHGKTLGQFEAV